MKGPNMSDKRSFDHLITYDIADPKRLARVFKRLKQAGLPIQYSVFYVKATTASLDSLMGEIQQCIDPKCDDVRAYRIPSHAQAVQIGAAILPTDVLPGAFDWLNQAAEKTSE